MRLLNDATQCINVIDGEFDVWKIIRSIAESRFQEEAFYVCDLGDIVRKYKEWMIKLPRVKPHYAVKCNNNPIILQVLAALGTGFDCASKEEINQVTSLGVASDRIIFANPTKMASHIREAAAFNVELMTFDNETELYKIKRLFPTAKLVIRIRCDAAVAQCQLGMKFGCDPENVAPHLLEVAESLGLDVVGVSFHVGSGCGDPPVFRRAIEYARKIFDYGKQLGYTFNLLDLGGGYPGNKGSTLDKIADVINAALDEYFPDPDVKIIAEPGRYYVASAYTLATHIHSKRETGNEDDLEVWYYVNDGIYGSFNSLLYDHAEVTPLPLNNSGKLTRSTIWGPTCDGLDKIADDVMLPMMPVGDWIVFEDMGAYTLPVASTFNGFPIPKVHVVVSKHISLLLRDLLPEHIFVENNISGLYLLKEELENWELPLFHQDDNLGDPLADLPITPPAFLRDFVEVGPIN